MLDFIIINYTMKKILILLVFVGLLIAVEPVPKDKVNKKSERKTEKVEKVKKIGKVTVKKDKARKDYFLDADSNAVNDQREEDYLKIKKLNSKFRDLFHRFFGHKSEKKSKKKKRYK